MTEESRERTRDKHRTGSRTDDLVWERSHGVCKRISTIAYLVRREFWRAQVAAAHDGGRSSASSK